MYKRVVLPSETGKGIYDYVILTGMISVAVAPAFSYMQSVFNHFTDENIHWVVALVPAFCAGVALEAAGIGSGHLLVQSLRKRQYLAFCAALGLLAAYVYLGSASLPDSLKSLFHLSPVVYLTSGIYYYQQAGDWVDAAVKSLSAKVGDLTDALEQANTDRQKEVSAAVKECDAAMKSAVSRELAAHEITKGDLARRVESEAWALGQIEKLEKRLAELNTHLLTRPAVTHPLASVGNDPVGKANGKSKNTQTTQTIRQRVHAVLLDDPTVSNSVGGERAGVTRKTFRNHKLAIEELQQNGME